MTDEHKDEKEEGEGEGSPGTGEGERTVPLSVLESTRADLQARLDQEIARADEAEARSAAPEGADEDDLSKYDEEELKVVRSIVSEEVGPLAEILTNVLKGQQASNLTATIKGIDGVPEEFLPDALEDEVKAKQAAAEKQKRFITVNEAYGEVMVEKLPDLIAAVGKTSEAKRQELLDKKKGAGVAHAGGGISPDVVGEKHWSESMPPEDRADRRAVVDKALEKAEETVGYTIPGGPA